MTGQSYKNMQKWLPKTRAPKSKRRAPGKSEARKETLREGRRVSPSGAFKDGFCRPDTIRIIPDLRTPVKDFFRLRAELSLFSCE
jgi:hypothetical protein